MIQACPCGSTADYSACCGRYIDLGVAAPNPERLMRSRYTAYVLGKAGYLRKTWHPDTCPALSNLAQDKTVWRKLDVHRSQAGFKHGLVEFSAQYETADGTRTLHEISRFRKIKNRWLYVDALPDWPVGQL